MRKVVSAVALMLIAPLAQAQTTRTYSCAALERSVTPSSDNPVTYTYDAADNRTSVVARITNYQPVEKNDTFYVELDNEGATYHYRIICDWWLSDSDPNAGGTIVLQRVGGYPSVLIWPDGRLDGHRQIRIRHLSGL